MTAHVEYLPHGQAAFQCTLTTSSGRQVVVEGAKGDLDPVVSGDEPLTGNRALVANLWAHAKEEFLRRRSRNKDRRASAQKSASRYLRLAKAIAELADQESIPGPTAWCSACFQKVMHRRVGGWSSRTAAHLCTSCGGPTSPLCCAALRQHGLTWYWPIPRACLLRGASS